MYLLLAQLGLYEAPAHIAYGLDRYQEVVFVETQEPSPSGMQEANLPVDFVDQEVPDEAYVLVVGIDELAVDEVAWREEDVCPLPRIIHKQPPS